MERRLAAIFAADVAGFSRLMSDDEAGTMQILTSHRKVMDALIAQHTGRIANTAGDSVLAEFRSVVNAVECARQIQLALASANDSLPEERKLRFRIGVHVGDVMLSGGDLLGDAVNIAARIQALAEPGGICLSAAAQQYVRKALPIVVRDLGFKTVRNIAEPIRVYAVESQSRQETGVISRTDTATAPGHPLGVNSSERMRHVGVLLAVASGDAEYVTLIKAFLQRLQQLGWNDGTNVRIDVRWSGASAEAVYKHAADLAALGPDVIVAPGSASAGPLLKVTPNIPVVFTVVPDPVGAGFVDSLDQPGGNATGVASFEYSLGRKWLEILKEAAPGVARVGVLRDPAITAGIGQWSAIHAAAPAVGLHVTPINLRDALDLERALVDFARHAQGGLVVTSSALSVRHRDLIVRAAAEQKLPAVYYSKAFVMAGGLLSYGSDRADQFRRAAGYVDRILNGEKPADLPILSPSNYELAVSITAAAALGLCIPNSLLARADEVVEE
jgi:putative ABC transport system substrate-binding protein